MLTHTCASSLLSHTHSMHSWFVNHLLYSNRLANIYDLVIMHTHIEISTLLTPCSVQGCVQGGNNLVSATK